MPVIRVNAIEDRPLLHQGGPSFADALGRVDPGTGPAIVMIHGYKYLPGHPVHCPHGLILATRPATRPFRPASWPRQLGFGTGHRDEGLAVAFGWQARGLLWQAQARTRPAGRALAAVIADIRAHAPGRPVHVMAHSMGIELAFEALHHLPPGSVQRIVSLTGASYLSRAEAALATPAGRTAEVINVTSRENDPFDFLYERLIAAPMPGDRAIGHGFAAPNAVTLQIDHPATLGHLDRLGMPIAAPERMICHWSSYTRPGLLGCYNRLLRHPNRYPLAALQPALDRPDPRWTRLLPRRRAHPGLAVPERGVMIAAE